MKVFYNGQKSYADGISYLSEPSGFTDVRLRKAEQRQRKSEQKERNVEKIEKNAGRSPRSKIRLIKKLKCILKRSKEDPQQVSESDSIVENGQNLPRSHHRKHKRYGLAKVDGRMETIPTAYGYDSESEASGEFGVRQVSKDWVGPYQNGIKQKQTYDSNGRYIIDEEGSRTNASHGWRDYEDWDYGYGENKSQEEQKSVFTPVTLSYEDSEDKSQIDDVSSVELNRFRSDYLMRSESTRTRSDHLIRSESTRTRSMNNRTHANNRSQSMSTRNRSMNSRTRSGSTRMRSNKHKTSMSKYGGKTGRELELAGSTISLKAKGKEQHRDDMSEITGLTAPLFKSDQVVAKHYHTRQDYKQTRIPADTRDEDQERRTGSNKRDDIINELSTKEIDPNLIEYENKYSEQTSKPDEKSDIDDSNWVSKLYSSVFKRSKNSNSKIEEGIDDASTIVKQTTCGSGPTFLFCGDDGALELVHDPVPLE